LIEISALFEWLTKPAIRQKPGFFDDHQFLSFFF